MINLFEGHESTIIAIVVSVWLLLVVSAFSLTAFISRLILRKRNATDHLSAKSAVIAIGCVIGVHIAFFLWVRLT